MLGTLRFKLRSLAQGQCSLTQKATAANYGPAMVVSAVVDCACGNQVDGSPLTGRRSRLRLPGLHGSGRLPAGTAGKEEDFSFFFLAGCLLGGDRPRCACKIAKLINLVSNSDVAEINLKQGDEELRICRQTAPVAAAPAVQTVIAPAPAVAPVAAPAAAPVAAPAAAAVAAAPAAVDDSKIMRSTMVGTFSGTIKRILVENGSTVEFDQPIFEFE